MSCNQRRLYPNIVPFTLFLPSITDNQVFSILPFHLKTYKHMINDSMLIYLAGSLILFFPP